MITVEALQAQISAIQAALSLERLEDLPQLLAAHDAMLNEFIRNGDVRGKKSTLKQLHDMQVHTVALMRQYQQKLLLMMRAQRSSLRAARAYTLGGI